MCFFGLPPSLILATVKNLYSTSALCMLTLLATVPGMLAQSLSKTPGSPASQVASTAKVRARDLGVPFDGTPGPLNAITDVAGVEVGLVTLISGEGKLQVGKGPVRTGVTAILPRGKDDFFPCYAAWFTLNGNGEMTGTTWLEESGYLGSPILITNTHSVGVVRDAVIEWRVQHHQDQEGQYSGDVSLPVVAETYDGFLNDINGFHVRKEHVFQALDSAKTGPVQEGNVGGGTGMMALGFKGGTGTASRKVGDYTLGVLVQANFGRRQLLNIAGIPVGLEIKGYSYEQGQPKDGQGSIIVILATDAPLLPHQLKRLAKRISLGVGKVGGRGENSSGDIFLAFSTAKPEVDEKTGIATSKSLGNNDINPLFWATVEATEEAIINALVAARTMTGVNGNKAHGLPHQELKDLLRKYGKVKSK
jgi:D-aminopeptidase